MSENQQFLYQFEAVRPEMVRDPNAWTPDDVAVAEAHVAYLREATEIGTVILAGRSLDGVGPAIVIVEVASEEEARIFMEQDPFVREGLMRATLHPFRAAMIRRSS
ncbi:MAG: YciI family protein [Candidatus Promineifilaceae bacterium]|nr:YciI family protein [Candidatus Promineifilaceae bacterium]